MFLTNEYLNLQKHVVDRSLNLLKQAQVYEDLNKSNYIQNIMNDAAAAVDKVAANTNNEEL